jgi:hypothetical protein
MGIHQTAVALPWWCWYCVPTTSSHSGFCFPQLGVELPTYGFQVVLSWFYIKSCNLRLITELLMKSISLLFEYCSVSFILLIHFGKHVWHLFHFFFLLSLLPIGLGKCLCPSWVLYGCNSTYITDPALIQLQTLAVIFIDILNSHCPTLCNHCSVTALFSPFIFSLVTALNWELTYCSNLVIITSLYWLTHDTALTTSLLLQDTCLYYTATELNWLLYYIQLTSSRLLLHKSFAGL